MPRIRTQPEDFVVEELPEEPPCGAGHHTWLWLEKRCRNSEDVAHELARIAGVPADDVGFAGRKDRVAVTRQWFSVPGLDPALATSLELADARVLQAARHGRKLRAGMLRGNRFAITVRDVSPAQAATAQERLTELTRRGMPNRFGQQRFGSGGGNVQLGLEVLRGRTVNQPRRTRWLMVSALQSAVFNEVLARRPVPWDQVVLGEVAWEHATGWQFWVEDAVQAATRAERFEISPSGPLFGYKAKRPRGVIGQLEKEVMADFGLADFDRMEVPRGLHLRGDRRPLRVLISEATCEPSEDALHLRFVLPPGSYATVLLEELFPGGLAEGGEISDDMA